MTRVQIKYSRPWSWLLTLLGAPARWSDVRVDGSRVRVRMSALFRTEFERSQVRSVERYRPCASVGAHGRRGRWLVNGANRPIAQVVLGGAVPARILGFRIELRELLVSVADVAELRRVLLP